MGFGITTTILIHLRFGFQEWFPCKYQVNCFLSKKTKLGLRFANADPWNTWSWTDFSSALHWHGWYDAWQVALVVLKLHTLKVVWLPVQCYKIEYFGLSGFNVLLDFETIVTQVKSRMWKQRSLPWDSFILKIAVSWHPHKYIYYIC